MDNDKLTENGQTFLLKTLSQNNGNAMENKL